MHTFSHRLNAAWAILCLIVSMNAFIGGNAAQAAAPREAPAPPTSPAVAQLIVNSGFEEGTKGWLGTVDDIGVHSSAAAHRGSYLAWMGGFGQAHHETLYQNVSIPSGVHRVMFSFWLHIETDETTRRKAYDRLYVQVRSPEGHVLRTLAIYSNLNRTRGYVRKTLDVSRFTGKNVEMFLKVVEDNGKPSSFFLDDFALSAQ
jgi:hypothetical protein